MKAIINVIGEIIAAILGGFFQLLVEVVDVIGKKNPDEQATYGKKKKIISYSNNSSFYIGDLAIEPKIAMNSAVIIGKTGTGKTSTVYKVSLLNTPIPKINPNDPASMSYVVLDPAMENERDTAGYNQERGYQTDTINFLSAKTSTVSWNPIAGLTDSGVTRFAAEYIETALRNSNSSDPFWGLSAQRVLAFAIDLLRQFGERYTNLYNARYIVQTMSGNREQLDQLMSLPNIPNELFERYVSIVNMGSKLLSSVLTTTLASLELFSDPEIAQTTSTTTLNMEAYRERSHILYVQTKIMDQEYVSILNTLLFSAFFSFCMKEIPQELENSIAFKIDECSSLKMKPSLLPLACSNLRKHRSYGIYGFQSISQIEELYGKQNAKTVLQNVGTTLYFPGQDLQTAQQLSSLLGKYTLTDSEGRKTKRDLLTPDEIAFLKHQGGGLLFSGSERGILFKNIRPFFKNRTLLKRSKVSPPKRKYLQTTMPELLPIEQLLKQNL